MSKIEGMNLILEYIVFNNFINRIIFFEVVFFDDGKVIEEDYELNLLFNIFESGVVCFDGIFFGYYLYNGIGLGKFKWIVFF